MKSIQKTFFSIFIGMTTLLVSTNALAEVDDACTEAILLSCYPEKFVGVTLKRFEIPQSQWSSIQRELAEKDKEVVPRVAEKAEKMTPNPLRDSQNRQQGIKMFRETRYELFADVMQAHGINNQKQIEGMLNDIQQQQGKQFSLCVEQYSGFEKSAQ